MGNGSRVEGRGPKVRSRGSYLAAMIMGLAGSAAAQAPQHWRLVPEVTYGTRGDPAAELTNVVGFVVADNGDVLVLDGESKNLRRFSADGKLQATIGREGAGPGEFRGPTGMVRGPGNTIWIGDLDNHRYSVHASDGTFLRNIPSGTEVAGPLYSWDRFVADGRLVHVAFVINRKTGDADEMFQRRAFGAGSTDTVPVPKCLPPTLANYPQSTWEAGAHIPFMPYGLIAVDHDGTAWCGYGGASTLYHLRLGAHDTLGVIHGTVVAVAVSAAERDSAIAAIRKYTGPDFGKVDLGRIPRVHPLITTLQLDDAGRVWVRLWVRGNRTRAQVFSPMGRLVADVDGPATLDRDNIVIRGDHLYGVVKDQDDIPSIVRYRIERR